MKLRLRKAGLITLLVLLVAGLITQLPPVQIRYHRWCMQRNWDKTFEKPDVNHHGLVGYSLGESYKRYEYHRDELVKIGAVKKLRYAFKHIQLPTLESSHLSKLLLSRECPSYIDLDAPYPREPEPMKLTVWFYPEHANLWDEFLQAHDVEDYREKIVAPSVRRKSREYIAGWSTMGMWLPDEDEVHHFRINLELARDILAQSLADADGRVRTRAAYVIGEIGEEAKSLGPDLLGSLRQESDRTVRLYFVDALQAVRFNDAAAVAELQRRFESLSDVNTPLKPDDNDYAEVDERIHISAALYVLDNEANREQYLEFVMKWLQPPPGGLDHNQIEGYWQRRLSAVLALEKMAGASDAIPLLEAMLNEDDAQPWVSVHIPRVIGVLRDE